MSDIYTQAIQGLAEIDTLRDALKKGTGSQGALALGGVSDSAKNLVLYGAAGDIPWKIVVCENDRTAKERAAEYAWFDENTVFFPGKDLLFYQSDLRSNELTRERIRAIDAFLHKDRLTIFASASALMNMLPPRENFEKGFITISDLDTIEPEALIKLLVKNGYENVTEVAGPGEFTSRGGIIDVFPLTAEYPVRLEFFGDEIDSMRTFDTESQKSIEKIESFTLCPAGEFIVSAEEKAAGIKAVKADLKKQYDALREAKETEAAFRVKTRLEDFEEAVETGWFGQEFETYLPYFCKKAVSLTDWLPKEGSLLVFDEPSRISTAVKGISDEFSESMKRRIETGEAALRQAELLFSEESTYARWGSLPGLTLSMLDYTKGKIRVSARYYIHTTEVVSYRRDFELFTKDLAKYRKNKFRVAVISPSRTRAKKLAEDIQSYGVNCYYSEDLDRDTVPGEIIVTVGGLTTGTIIDASGWVFITETDIFGSSVRKKTRKIKRYTGGEKVRSLRDLHVGDYVVHENYGLGIYRGLEKIDVGGVTKDYIKIAYAKGDNLYILATQFDMIGKYSGAEGKKPKLNALNSREWSETKSRVRKAVGEIADDLVELYAERQQETGFVYSKDGQMQREFEDNFPYEETDSQLAAIEDVKKDMESPKIMDRLICGDVGYGKTEVALRAAFKAVCDGKQVVYLCPTTILAEQHYNTFTERMSPFAVSVAMMSRFRSAAENKKTVCGLKNGTVDVCIATHRVLSKDVAFKNLGLLIIDEEQRFGVTHKEKIKKLKKNVDVLSLSATPIPRTLHMSLAGIRDMSLLEEAPVDRMPIQTFVMERSPEIVREAIDRELARGGQVYYVYNKVKDIADVAAEIQKLVPDASVAFAHGKMSEGDLESIMSDFINRRIDVLVATTIIEIGLDISNVNTIIIHDADRLGLSQLYQLRGRVGRSNRTAYAFLMYRKDRMLAEVAEKRLAAIREFTDLGSGFKIAMRDLEIRGAGNLLGEAQSGHMEAVGYDLYVKLLSEAIAAKKGQETAPDFETSIDLMIDAYIPETYIPDASQKLEAYKRIAGIKTEEDRTDVTDELLDRYGDLPKPVSNLMDIAILKARAHAAFITNIKQKGSVYTFALLPSGQIDPGQIPAFVEAEKPYLRFNVGRGAAGAEGAVPPSFTFDAAANNRLSKADVAAIPTRIVAEIADRLVMKDPAPAED